MRRHLTLSFYIALFIPIWLNAQNDSIIFLNKVREQDRKIADYKGFRDSLRIEFDKQPPIVNIDFEIDKDIIQLSDNYEFWYEKDGLRFNPEIISNHRFLIDTISDTLSFYFKFDMDTLKFLKIGFGWIRNGADFHFGKINDLDKIRNIYKSHKKDEDFNKWTDFGQPYLRILENKKLMHQKRKIRSIDFLIINPNVFGDGAIIDIVNINLKNKN
jgi:hypothetical protein